MRAMLGVENLAVQQSVLPRHPLVSAADHRNADHPTADYRDAKNALGFGVSDPFPVPPGVACVRGTVFQHETQSPPACPFR